METTHGEGAQLGDGNGDDPLGAWLKDYRDHAVDSVAMFGDEGLGFGGSSALAAATVAAGSLPRSQPRRRRRIFREWRGERTRAKAGGEERGCEGIRLEAGGLGCEGPDSCAMNRIQEKFRVRLASLGRGFTKRVCYVNWVVGVSYDRYKTGCMDSHVELHRHARPHEKEAPAGILGRAREGSLLRWTPRRCPWSAPVSRAWPPPASGAGKAMSGCTTRGTDTGDPLGMAGMHNRIYASLRLIVPREAMSFSDFPFYPRDGCDARRYPGHIEFLLYVRYFCDKFGLMDSVRLHTEVLRVAQIGRGQYCRSIDRPFHLQVDDVMSEALGHTGHLTGAVGILDRAQHLLHRWQGFSRRPDSTSATHLACSS
ncbi:hypothetical protein EJB05_40674, partial [Eragrostis curvula]